MFRFGRETKVRGRGNLFGLCRLWRGTNVPWVDDKKLVISSPPALSSKLD